METDVILKSSGNHGGSVEIALTKEQHSFIPVFEHAPVS